MKSNAPDKNASRNRTRNLQPCKRKKPWDASTAAFQSTRCANLGVSKAHRDLLHACRHNFLFSLLRHGSSWSRHQSTWWDPDNHTPATKPIGKEFTIVTLSRWKGCATCAQTRGNPHHTHSKTTSKAQIHTDFNGSSQQVSQEAILSLKVSYAGVYEYFLIFWAKSVKSSFTHFKICIITIWRYICRMNYNKVWVCINDLDSNTYHVRTLNSLNVTP